MSSKTIQYGPFTPQELESMVSEMQRKNIPFEIAKDEQEEGKFKRIDYANLVRQAHFRTEQYMAQIFYITIAKSDLEKVAVLLERLGFPSEVPAEPEELSEASSDDVFLKAKTEKKRFNRRMIARILVLFMICQIVLVMIFFV